MCYPLYMKRFPSIFCINVTTTTTNNSLVFKRFFFARGVVKVVLLKGEKESEGCIKRSGIVSSVSTETTAMWYAILCDWSSYTAVNCND